MMRPMKDAPKDGTPIIAKIRSDLAEYAPSYGWSRPEAFAGIKVVVRHPGIGEDGFDVGWHLAGPFGHGLGEDQYFDGWWPTPDDQEHPVHDALMHLERMLGTVQDEALAFTKREVRERLPRDWEIELQPECGIVILNAEKRPVSYYDLTTEMKVAVEMVDTLRFRAGIQTLSVASLVVTKDLAGNAGQVG